MAQVHCRSDRQVNLIIQAARQLKHLKEDGIATVLINPNIATIQTSEKFADKVYFIPLRTNFVEKVIKKEQPDSILLQFGGQTALNVGVDLFEKGIFDKYKIKVLGTPIRCYSRYRRQAAFFKKVH